MQGRDKMSGTARASAQASEAFASLSELFTAQQAQLTQARQDHEALTQRVQDVEGVQSGLLTTVEALQPWRQSLTAVIDRLQARVGSTLTTCEGLKAALDGLRAEGLRLTGTVDRVLQRHAALSVQVRNLHTTTAQLAAGQSVVVGEGGSLSFLESSRPIDVERVRSLAGSVRSQKPTAQGRVDGHLRPQERDLSLGKSAGRVDKDSQVTARTDDGVETAAVGAIGSASNPLPDEGWSQQSDGNANKPGDLDALRMPPFLTSQQREQSVSSTVTFYGDERTRLSRMATPTPGTASADANVAFVGISVKLGSVVMTRKQSSGTKRPVVAIASTEPQATEAAGLLKSERGTHQAAKRRKYSEHKAHKPIQQTTETGEHNKDTLISNDVGSGTVGSDPQFRSAAGEPIDQAVRATDLPEAINIEIENTEAQVERRIEAGEQAKAKEDFIANLAPASGNNMTTMNPTDANTSEPAEDLFELHKLFALRTGRKAYAARIEVEVVDDSTPARMLRRSDRPTVRSRKALGK